MENLTEFYPAFKQVGLKKTGGKGCAIICKDNDYECKSCPLQEALDKLYRLERQMSGVGTTVYACHYMIDTGKKRGVTPQECYKHEGTPYKKKKKGMTARKGVDIVSKVGVMEDDYR